MPFVLTLCTGHYIIHGGEGILCNSMQYDMLHHCHVPTNHSLFTKNDKVCEGIIQNAKQSRA